MGIEPKVISEAEPISEIDRINKPVGSKDVAGNQVNPATEDTLAAQLNITLGALRDAICAAGVDAKTLNDLYTRILEVQQNVYSQLIGADETVAQSITLDVAGRTLLDIYASAGVAATFRLDVSNDNTNWISDYLTWAAVTEVKETHTNAFRYLRLKSDAAGAAGDLVSLYLTGGR